MDYVRLGNTGLKVSRICLGTMTYGTPEWRPWILDEAASRPFFVRALEHGINFFDTADMYSRGVSEEVVGRALHELAGRDQVVIATKAFYPLRDGPNQRGLSRKHLFNAIDDSLRRLGTDYVDLYQIHRFDDDTPIEETLEALHDIVKAGKARYIGASSMHAWQFTTMLHVAEARGWTRFVSMQNHYNLVYREEEREMMPLCRAEVEPIPRYRREALPIPQVPSVILSTDEQRSGSARQEGCHDIARKTIGRCVVCDLEITVLALQA
jgi:aryl-alcohol dehydrogenase-like predicted oxidoreductase